jgi:hypothetical protein
VRLLDIEPPIWRRLLVPHAMALRTLHRVLQVVMGWEDYHLWEFRVGGEASGRGATEVRYGEPDPDGLDDTLHPVAGVRLRTIAPVEGARVEYVYDYGDEWRHAVTVEALLPNLLATTIGDDRLPYCVAGARACPPEDAGGSWGYMELLGALGGGLHDVTARRDREDPDPDISADELRAWAGGDFDPEAFSARQVNRELRLRFGPRSGGETS